MDKRFWSTFEKVNGQLKGREGQQVLYFSETGTPWFLEHPETRIMFDRTYAHTPALRIRVGYLLGDAAAITGNGVLLPTAGYAKKVLYENDKSDRKFKVGRGWMPLSVDETVRLAGEEQYPNASGLFIGDESVRKEEKNRLWFNKSYLDALAALGHPEPSQTSGKSDGFGFTIPTRRTMEALLREGHIRGSAVRVERERWRRQHPPDLKMILY